MVKDHDELDGQTPHDHHPQGTFFTVIINSQSIAGNTAYEHRVNLGREGHKTLWGTLRGDRNLGIQGHAGAFFLASDVEDECIGMCNSYSSYIYMGAFSRLHGDSYLSYSEFGNSKIRLRDAWIDGDEAVLEFYNTFSTATNLKCYGTVGVK